MRYTFEWDPWKARRNWRKHKISFERAAEAFLDPFSISIFDEKHSDEEDRWILIGKDSHEVTLVIVYTFDEMTPDEWMIRIISAWKATKNEMKQYEGYE